MKIILDGGPFDGAEISADGLTAAGCIVVRSIDQQGFRDIRQAAEYQLDGRGRAVFVDYIRPPGIAPAIAAGPVHKGRVCVHEWAWVPQSHEWACRACGCRQPYRKVPEGGQGESST